MFQLGKLLYHPGQLYVSYNWPIRYLLFRAPKEQPPTENKKEDESYTLELLDLGEISTWSVEQQQAGRKLLFDYSKNFQK